MYLKNREIEGPDQLGKGWDTPDINWYIRILSHR